MEYLEGFTGSKTFWNKNRRRKIKPQHVYSTKAEKYAKYRWDYAPKAIDEIIKPTGLSESTIIADIGAGTGILTKHFAEQAQEVYAIEPNAELRYFLKKALGDFPRVSIMDGAAEETGLPDNSVDLITVAQAIHWFEPRPAKEEMSRILKEDGWLALLRNYGADKEQGKAIGSLMTEEYGADFSVVHERSLKTPVSFYFGHDEFQSSTFPFEFKQSWEEFIGALTTASYMPDEDHPLFYRLEEEAKRIFTQHSNDGYLTIKGETELLIGQPQK